MKNKKRGAKFQGLHFHSNRVPKILRDYNPHTKKGSKHWFCITCGEDVTGKTIRGREYRNC